MAIETERKFLVKGSFEHLAVKKIRIKQSYFSTDPWRTIRLRIADEKGLLTFKSGIIFPRAGILFRKTRMARGGGYR